MTTECFASKDELDAALASRRFLVFKHSLICPTSAAAFAEYQSFRAARPDVPAKWIDVIGERPWARHVAEATGVAHESPQALYVRDGAVVWHASHGAITKRALEGAIARAD